MIDIETKNYFDGFIKDFNKENQRFIRDIKKSFHKELWSRPEMKKLRKEYNSYKRRLTRLENVLV